MRGLSIPDSRSGSFDSELVLSTAKGARDRGQFSMLNAAHQPNRRQSVPVAKQIGAIRTGAAPPVIIPNGPGSRRYTMNTIDKLHMIHRFWRYRLRTERNSLSYLLRLPLAGQVVIDVGANLGIYSYWMSKAAGPDGRVIAFEPQPELARHLEEMRSAFELRNVEIVNKALSSSVGSRMLFRPEPGGGGASFRRPHASWEQIEVEVTTLDDYYLDPTPVRFIKCDAEGHEYEVLRGSRRILTRDKPTLLLEIHDAEAAAGDIPKFLDELGYQGFFFHRGQRIDFARFAEVPHRKPWESHRNYVFVPRGLGPR